MTAITFLVCTGALVTTAVLDLRTAARETKDSASAAASLPIDAMRAIPAVASAKRYDASGAIRASYDAPRQPPSRIASLFLQPEIACSSIAIAGRSPSAVGRNPTQATANGQRPTANGTLCIETSTAIVAARAHRWLRILAFALPASLLIGFLGGRLLASSIARRLRRIGDVVEQATRDDAYSLRVESSKGELGRTIGVLNELLARMQEREVALRRRTAEVEAANKDLESFAYSVSHDLRAPLGSVDGFAQALAEYTSDLDENARECVHWIREAARQMRDLIEGLLQMSRLARTDIEQGTVDLTAIARAIGDSLRQAHPEREIDFVVRDGVRVTGDEHLLRAVMENLLSNAWKFTRDASRARVEFGVVEDNGHPAYFVRDNGAGFDPTHASKLFRPFQRLHSMREFEGTGIGLATVQRIIQRHGGTAWAEGDVGKGATIYFTMGTAA
ncbi:MAG TPA: ATP-binding protein [Thermoanaerobaculia bacterium]|nr:ATP-binding protein [Thermoanaerobaculia bacterium]